ncbi:MAG: TlpA family protein disulfide reductase [candidate division Zixibacteria bacterium]|nr:TlpA family protein disulfide reductase [candidate division Zixibacteria bacterium]MCI0596139.1 TlpA family protein disulfide reductase [candidate division Zixibacteria bacterium]
MIKTGNTAQAFALEGTDGKKHSLDEIKAKGIGFFAFFKVTCPTCQYTFPFLERIHQKIKAAGIPFWGIVQDPIDKAREFARQYGTTFPILIDDRPYLTSKIYGISIVPTWYLVDGSLKVLAVGESWVKKEYVDLATLLAQKTGAEILGLFSPDENVVELKPG